MASSTSSSRLIAIGGIVFAVGVVLVLFLVRGGDDGPSATPTQSPTTGAVAEPSPTPTPTATDVTSAPAVSTKIDIPADLALPEGTEAVAVDLSYLRDVAALPSRGDVVRLYRLPPVAAGEDSPTPADANGDGQPDVGPGGEVVLEYRPPFPPAEAIGLDLEVMAVIGAHPVARGASSTLVFAVPTNRVPEVLALVNAGELWVTLLPSDGG